MRTVFHDLRYSLRQFLKTPGFTLTAVISLALGIGATTAVFSVIYAALLNPYPYHAADRIVRLTVQSKADPEWWVTLDGPQNSATPTITSYRESAGHGFPRLDMERARAAGKCQRH